ncbi:MAG: Rieske (2Fe-2S) protein [Candidatus Nitrosopumilus sp. bin_32a]
MELKIKKSDIPIGKLIEVSTSPKVIIFNNGEKYFAISGICPHAKWPLELGFVKDETLTCGGHGWEFNIENGECITNPGRDLINYNILENTDEIIISD